MMSKSIFVLATLALAGEAKLLYSCKNEHGECSATTVVPARAVPGGVGIASSTPRTPNDRFGVLAAATAGWTDLPKSSFVRFHDYLLLRVATTIPRYTVQPRTLSWGCTNQITTFNGDLVDVGSCMALVFVYRCGKCKSAGQEEIVGKMLLEGWQPVHCAGYFDLHNEIDSHLHRFTMFYQEFASTPTSDDTRTLVIEHETEFMFWGQIHKDTSMCAQQGDEKDCDKLSTDDCYWDAKEGACKPRMCPKPVSKEWAVGPGVPECQTCVSDESDLLKKQ